MKTLITLIFWVLISTLTACGGGGGGGDTGTTPPSTDAVWDTDSWDEKNWQ